MMGQVIEALRESRGWTQAELAGRAGLGQNHISMIENNRHVAGLLTLGKIAKAFDMERAELVKLIDKAEAGQVVAATAAI
jgi:transcriptional regulator with XRE-family HTH domain